MDILPDHIHVRWHRDVLAQCGDPRYPQTTAKFEERKHERRLLIRGNELPQMQTNAEELMHRHRHLPLDFWAVMRLKSCNHTGTIPRECQRQEEEEEWELPDGDDDDDYDEGAGVAMETCLSQTVQAENELQARHTVAQRIQEASAVAGRCDNACASRQSFCRSIDDICKIAGTTELDSFSVEVLAEAQVRIKTHAMQLNPLSYQLQGSIVSSNLALETERVHKRLKGHEEPKRRKKRAKPAPRQDTVLNCSTVRSYESHEI